MKSMESLLDTNQSLVPLDDYKILWGETQGLSPEDLLDIEQKSVHFSADLTEATYNIPFKVIDENNQICNEVMADFVPWLVFHELFSLKKRTVDMQPLIEQGYWDGPDTVVSTRGTFMGDGMSFIHLSLLLSGLVRASCIDLDEPNRPFGQSVGDDLVLLAAKFLVCLNFCRLAEAIGCKFSKLNAISDDSAIFCEENVCSPSDLENYEDLKNFAESIFGDLLFLDIIKGSLMSGRSKVKADGKSPFIGHASALNKQIRWNPYASTKERSKIFLWASNFMEAKRLGSAMASLPHPLGGADLAIGTILNYRDDKFYKEMLPYYERMLTLELGDFLKYYILLTGIYRANPKGFVWENDWKIIKTVIEDCEILDKPNIDTLIPEGWKGDRNNPLEKLKYINLELRLISIRDLADELCRREAFLKMWEGKVNKSFMTLKVTNVRQRSNKAWAVIKSNLQPMPPENFRSKNMSDLTLKFQERSWGLYVSKDDPAISRAYCGTPSLFMDLDDYLVTEHPPEEG